MIANPLPTKATTMNTKPKPDIQVIPEHAIQQEYSSYVDHQGQLFHYDNHIFRCIYPEAAPLFQRLYNDGILTQLEIQSHLVPSHLSDLRFEGKEGCLIMEHDRIWPLSYAPEWCPSMLYDAARVTIDLAQELAKHDLILQDAYPWNILFQGSQATHVDLTSIAPVDPSTLWPAHEQFEAFFLRPLALAKQGKGLAARQLLTNYVTGISLDEFYNLTSARYKLTHPFTGLSLRLNNHLQRNTATKEKIRKMAEQAIRDVSPQVRQRFLKKQAAKLASARPQAQKDHWSDYYGEIDEQFDKATKLKTIQELLQKTKPKTVLDIGCNIGIFSREAARTGASVLALDSSQSCIEHVYTMAKQDNLSITPLIADIVSSTPAFGFMGKQYPGLMDRAACDLVCFLGIMHHVHVSGRQSFERMTEMLDHVATRYLIFEYVAINDANMPHLPQRRAIDYTEESVKLALSNYFPTITTYPSDRPTRTLFLCEK